MATLTERIDNILDEVKKSKSMKMDFECMECGKKFSKGVKNMFADVRCPKCRGVDVEPQ